MVVPCDVCNKLLSNKKTLWVHKKVHTGDKPYSCDTCGKSFSQYSSLTTHKRIHTGEQPYSCDTCGESYTHRSALAKHNRTHTGEKPFSCEVCHKFFYTASELHGHNKSLKHLKVLNPSDFPPDPIIAASNLLNLKKDIIKMSVKKSEKLSCVVCNKEFKSSDVLNIHKYMHPELNTSNDIKLEVKEDSVPVQIKAENVKVIIKQEMEYGDNQD